MKQVYLRTSVSVFLLNCTLFAIISIADSRTSTNYASSLVTSIITFIAYSNQSTGSNIRIANYTTSITFFTQSTNSHTSLFSTKYQIWMMLCHIKNWFSGTFRTRNVFGHGSPAKNWRWTIMIQGTARKQSWLRRISLHRLASDVLAQEMFVNTVVVVQEVGCGYRNLPLNNLGIVK